MQKSDIEVREDQRADSTEARVGADALVCPADRKLGPRHFALAVLQLYKRWISPALPPSCRYIPTCSEYAMEAIERYGALRGGLIAAWRLLRCHPLAKGGLDPVVTKILSSEPKHLLTLSEHHPTLSERDLTLPEHHPTLSSRPKQIIAKAMTCAAEGPCVSPCLNLNPNQTFRSTETTSNQFGRI